MHYEPLHRTPIRAAIAVIIVATLSLLSACSEAPPEEAEQVTLPVSVNEVMVSLINHSADPIWIAAWRNPRSERDWRELEHLARQLQLGGALLTTPGTGPVDREWTEDPRWQTYSMQLAETAGRAVNAARTRDVQLISRAGDEIVEVCEGCHIDFKADLPTMNIYGELSPTAGDF